MPDEYVLCETCRSVMWIKTPCVRCRAEAFGHLAHFVKGIASYCGAHEGSLDWKYRAKHLLKKLNIAEFSPPPEHRHTDHDPEKDNRPDP